MRDRMLGPCQCRVGPSPGEGISIRSVDVVQLTERRVAVVLTKQRTRDSA